MSKGMRQNRWCESERRQKPDQLGLEGYVEEPDFLSRALGSHKGVLSKGGTRSALCFRKTSLKPSEEGGLDGAGLKVRRPGRRLGQ